MTMHTKSYAKAKLSYKAEQGTIEPKKLTKIVSFYNDPYSFRQMPVSETFIQNLAIEWTTFAKNDTSVVRLDDFYIFKGIPEQTMIDWAEKYPVLKEAKVWVTRLIANHRERGAIFKDGPLTDRALKMMRIYDPDWKQAEDEMASLNKANQSTNTLTIVEIPAIPSPEKKDE
jgi:hypothetical protein